MAEIKEKHPNWFKLKLERRELIRQLSPETAVNVLLACWDFLVTGEKPGELSPIESVAFSAFIPDLDEAWKKYLQRINARGKSTDIDRSHTISVETEEETETESDSLLLRNKDRESRADKPPTRPRFIPPTVDQVRAYCLDRGNGVDADLFVDFYTARGWSIGKGKMRDWKAAVRTWEKRQTANADEEPPPPRKTGHLAVDEDGNEVVRFE